MSAADPVERCAAGWADIAGRASASTASIIDAIRTSAVAVDALAAVGIDWQPHRRQPAQRDGRRVSVRQCAREIAAHVAAGHAASPWPDPATLPDITDIDTAARAWGHPGALWAAVRDHDRLGRPDDGEPDRAEHRSHRAAADHLRGIAARLRWDPAHGGNGTRQRVETAPPDAPHWCAETWIVCTVWRTRHGETVTVWTAHRGHPGGLVETACEHDGTAQPFAAADSAQAVARGHQPPAWSWQ